MKISYVFIIEKSIALLYPLCLEKGIPPIYLQMVLFYRENKEQNKKNKN